ncbi:hypothetical protein N9J65_03295 [Flavobacteriaceae bacterium]|nr:hypothetical protein [Flavobacteriaceae bacterium]
MNKRPLPHSEKKEDLIAEIAARIQTHRELENKNLSGPYQEKNLAVAISYVNYFGGQKHIWLTTQENLGGYKPIRDINGSIISTTSGSKTTITEDGFVVNKNSKIGEVIIRNVHGNGQLATPKGKQPIEVLNLTSYVPNPHNSSATDVVMDIVEGQQKKRFSSLSDLIRIINKAELQLEELEQKENALRDTDYLEKFDKELENILKQKEEAREARENALTQARSFIRKSAELRYQPILDPWQEETKRSLIYSGTLAIDGGPGTGKTTALIQRIKFLLDKDAMLGDSSSGGDFLSEGYLSELSEVQRKTLFENKDNWVFFTPNELLKLFLKNNMLREGLSASDDKVRVWDDYLNILVKDYELVKSETQNPFLFLRKRVKENLFKKNGSNTKAILLDFEKFMIKLLNSKLTKLLSLNVENFSWKAKGLSIQNYINNQEKDYSLEGIIRLYFNLQESYGEEVLELQKGLNNLLSKEAVLLEQKVSENELLKSRLYEFADSWKSTSTNLDDADTEEDDEELEDKTGDLSAFLFGKYKILIKNFALSRFDNGVKLGKKYTEFKGILEQDLKIEQFEYLNRVGELAYFVKYFVTCTKGVSRNVFSEIPKAYKAFRKEQLNDNNKNWDFSLLSYIVLEDKSKNKRLHPHEQALLVSFINNIIAKTFKVSKRKFKDIKHPYFEAFRKHSVPVIGVDEATDFHVVDLLAMHSLSDLEISSVTYSGDLMQRLTSGGIRRWDELKKLITNLEVSDLKVSYRQSPTLLDLASFIYIKATNKEPEYISYLESDPNEPKPLLYKSNDEEEKIEWIGERILEIYNAYGRKYIPSIAIFLADNDGLEVFTKKLNEIDGLADVGIKVRASKDGQVLGDKNTVRVFPVEYIKGMEFEAVFFHNMDHIQNVFNSQEMVMKHLYVGLSRASFYIGVTTYDNKEFEYLEHKFECVETSWR